MTRAARPPVRGTAAALVRASHPGPTAAVTTLAAVLCAAHGQRPREVAAVTGAVLSGQLSIGWSNDLLDAGRDAASGRADKPVAAGVLPRRTVAGATAVALGACVPLSLCSGTRAAAAHLLTVGGGWAYNLGLKGTPLSWAPYAVGFGALPAYVVLGLPGAPPVPPWLVGAGALIGTGAHMFNALPDLAQDRATGVASLPVRLGARGARVAGAGLLLAAGLLVGLAPPGRPGGWDSAGMAAGALLAGGAASPRHDPGSRAPFLLAVAAAAVDVALLARRGAALSRGAG